MFGHTLMTVLMAMLVLLVHSATLALTIEECQPSCHGHSPGDLVEDPMNCTQFYVCINADEVSNHPVACQPPTGVFDPLHGKCVDGNTCEASCALHSCRMRCNSTLDILPDVSNCRRYYMCDAGFDTVGPYECPTDTPFFNGETCVENNWQCCKVNCTAFCHPGDVQIIDPMDCMRYYICLEEGPALETNHFKCPEGYIFQASSSICIPGVSCHDLCEPPSVPTTTISTTTTDCVDHWICDELGNFPMCLTCNSGYFHCPALGVSGVPTACDDGFLFNTDPTYPFCVKESECPYTPPTVRHD